MSIGARFPQVLSAAADGVEWAWGELYTEFAPQLLRFLRNQGAAEPEDLLGDCFLHLLRGIAGFSGDEASFRSWAFTVARSRLIDSWRRAGRRPVALSVEFDDVGQQLAPGAAADVPTMEAAGVAEILERLTAEQRAVVVLRFVDRFSVRETAQILNRSEGSVKLLQHRAIASLRKALS